MTGFAAFGRTLVAAAISLFASVAGEQKYEGALASLQPSGPNGLRFASLSGDGRTVFAGLSSGEFHTWDVAKEEVKQRFKIGREGRAYGLGPKGTVFTLHADGSVVQRDGKSGAIVASFEQAADPVTALQVSSEGTKLALVRRGGTTFMGLDHRAIAFVQRGYQPCFDASGRYAAVWVRGEKVAVYDLSSGKVAASIPSTQNEVDLAALSPKAKTIALGLPAFGIYETRTGKLIHELPESGDFSGKAVFSHDGRYLLTGHVYGFARLYSASTGKLLKTFRGRERGSSYPVLHLSFSSDDKLCAVGYWEGGVAIYRVPSLKG